MPNQLYRLTIAEVYQLYEGWEFEYVNSWKQAAFISANLMNLHSKKKYTVDSLLGLKRPKKEKSKETIREEWDYLKRRF